MTRKVEAMLTEVATIVTAIIAVGGAAVGGCRLLIEYGAKKQKEKDRLDRLEKK